MCPMWKIEMLIQFATLTVRELVTKMSLLRVDRMGVLYPAAGWLSWGLIPEIDRAAGMLAVLSVFGGKAIILATEKLHWG